VQTHIGEIAEMDNFNAASSSKTGIILLNFYEKEHSPDSNSCRFFYPPDRRQLFLDSE